MSQSDQRTEKPTPRRLQKAREEGQFLVSRELVYGLQITVFVFALSFSGKALFEGFANAFRAFLTHAPDVSVTHLYVADAMRSAVPATLLPLFLVAAGLVVTGLCAQLLITQFGFATTKLTPDLKRLVSMERLKNMPRQNLRTAVEAVVLLPVIAGVLWLVVSDRVNEILLLPLAPMKGAMLRLSRMLLSLGQYGVAFLLLWGLLDFVKQARRRNKELRMTKQEIRDEWKQNEGSPEVKGRIRRIQRDMVRRRMLSDVKTATAIVVNPTHYSVAIRYDMGSMMAPKVVAKGKNLIALRIRELAHEHLIPIVENKPLARALYAECEVGQEIPLQLYRAVAEVLAYVFRITGGNRRV